MKQPADAEVSQLIEITGYCQAFYCLPEEGGLFDQNPYLMQAMYWVLEAQQEVQDRHMKDLEAKAQRGSRS